jgi:hypothetical protein
MNDIIVYYAFINNLTKNGIEQYNSLELFNLRKYSLSLRDKTKDNKRLFMCPSFIERTKNIYYFNVPEDFTILTDDLDNPSVENGKHIRTEFSLILFSESNLDVLFSSPYFHNVSHSNAFVPPTKLNIGMWYRPFNVQYLTFDNKVVFSKGDPLAYVEFLTDASIIFKEYNFSFEHKQYVGNEVGICNPYFKYIPMKDRYKIFNASGFKDIILDLCENNLREGNSNE